MKEMARDLKRDPKAQAILSSRGDELGMEPGSRLSRMMRDRDIDRAITESLRRSRGPGVIAVTQPPEDHHGRRTTA